MPTARMSIRLRAFFLDWIFVSVFISMLTSFIASRLFPEAIDTSNQWIRDFIQWLSRDALRKDTPMPRWNEALANFMSFAQLLSFICFSLYFTIAEAFFSGYTFGKSICRIRTINIVTLKKPFLLSTILRSLLKALSLLSPIIMLATLIVLQFNKRRQMGHDILCRTVVVDERYLSSIDQIR